jgi:hypothetical protein
VCRPLFERSTIGNWRQVKVIAVQTEKRNGAEALKVSLLPRNALRGADTPQREVGVP